MTAVAAPKVVEPESKGALPPTPLMGLDRLRQTVGNPCEFGSVTSPDGKITGIVKEVEFTPDKLSVTFVEGSRRLADGTQSREHDGKEHLFVAFRSALEVVDLTVGAVAWRKGERDHTLYVAYDPIEKSL